MEDGSRRSSLGGRSMRQQHVQELLSLSSSLRLRVNSRSISAAERGARPSLSSVFDELKTPSLLSSSSSSASSASSSSASASSSEHRDEQVALLQSEVKRLSAERDALKAELAVVKQDNMLLTQDFDDAVSAMESLSRRHALELASVSDVSPKLEALSACNAENTRLKLKINSLLSQISDIAFVSDSTSETNY